MNGIKKGPQMLQTSGRDSSLDSLGGRIRAARKKAGLKVGAVAKEIELSRTSLSQWEAGAVKNPDVEKLGQFCRITEVSLDWLLERKGPDPDLAPARGGSGRKAARVESLPPGDGPGGSGLHHPIPEIAASLSTHARKIDPTPRAFWVVPHDVLEIGFHAVPSATVVKRVATKTGPQFALDRGDYMLLDTSRNRIDEPGLYLLPDLDGESAVRAVVTLVDGQLKVTASADDLHRDRSLGQETVESLTPLGRVMGVFKPL